MPLIARQLAAEGVHEMVVVTDGTPRRLHRRRPAARTPIRHRDELDRIQRELRRYPGVSVLIYDQTCAAERRRRKRGTLCKPAAPPVHHQ